MTFQAGARLGPYEIVAPLGAGGMGEVWRARDTRLDRDVAIKVLPPGLARSEQFLQRFEREAKAISQLNHPHVCTLYDVGEVAMGGETLRYLVLELLEGESLADRIAKGPLPLPEVLKLGRQVASALDAAHRRGITHRDLKPGNIVVTRSGAKLLDFGLAKTATGDKAPLDGRTDLPTEAKPLTEEGTILGTFQYMAPEQLDGREAGARTDIFALGCVLHEMATGRRAFQGASKASLIAAIVSAQPEPISSTVALTPPVLDYVVRKCLEKDPDDRWQSAHDVAGQLQWISEAGPAAGALPGPSATRHRRAALAGWLVAVLVAGGWTLAALGRKPVPPPRVETAIVAGDGVFLDSEGGGLALSPDGRRLAFVAHRAGDKPSLWVRDLGSSAARPLAGTEGAALPFWSPDGKAVAFFASGKVLRLSVDGGSPVVVATDAFPAGGAWAPDGSIVYPAGRLGGILFRVPVSGGTPVAVVDMPGRSPRYPVMLPDGRRFLFTSLAPSAGALYVGSLDGSDPKLALEGVYSNAAYAAPGVILHVKDGVLRAHPVDPETLAPLGDPVGVADDVQYVPDDQNALFAVSDSGSLAYVPGEEAGRTELAWVSREGKELQVLGPPAMYYTPKLSHDERRLAVDVSDAQTVQGDIWIFDLQRGGSTRLTYDPANESRAIWTPGDRALVFFSEKNGRRDLYERSAGGVGAQKPVLVDDRMKGPLDITPDGRWLAFSVGNLGGTDADVWMLDRQSGTASAFLASPFAEGALQFSPDGRWVAYASDESGQGEVYVLQFPEPSGKWVVSRGGGGQPVWSADGRQIYYLSRDGKLMSVPVALGDTFEAGAPVPLFEVPIRSRYATAQYCVSKDGSRFLVNRTVQVDDTRPITFVQGWRAGVVP